MGDVRIIVDHLKLEYSGVFDTKKMFKFLSAWFMERGIQKKDVKNYEQNLADGKAIEFEIAYIPITLISFFTLEKGNRLSQIYL